MIEQRNKVGQRTLLAGTGAMLGLAPLADCVTAPVVRCLALVLPPLVSVQSVKSADEAPPAKETVAFDYRPC